KEWLGFNLVEQQKAIHEMALSGEIGISTPLNRAEWGTISQMLVVPKPFLKATETLSTGNTPFSQALPLVRELEKIQGINVPGWGRPLSPDLQALVRWLKKGIRRQLDPLRSSTVHMMAAMCNLKVKGSMCTGSPKTLDHWTQVLVNKVREAQVQRQGDVEEGEPFYWGSTPSTSQSPPRQPLPMWAMGMASMLGSNAEALALVAAYLAEDMEMLLCDPLAYWASRSQIQMDLATVAHKHLSCPPTSILSERVFSITGDVVIPHCTCLDPGLVEQLVFLKVNLPLLGFPRLQVQTEGVPLSSLCLHLFMFYFFKPVNAPLSAGGNTHCITSQQRKNMSLLCFHDRMNLEV
uniref:HAT C-terminal dimerisation domain-containing protein n=1 Tax=Crocodylus porosus TaxID=8502 RepID=A0A7M4F8Z7_CROPO